MKGMQNPSQQMTDTTKSIANKLPTHMNLFPCGKQIATEMSHSSLETRHHSWSTFHFSCEFTGSGNHLGFTTCHVFHHFRSTSPCILGSPWNASKLAEPGHPMDQKTPRWMPGNGFMSPRLVNDLYIHVHYAT